MILGTKEKELSMRIVANIFALIFLFAAAVAFVFGGISIGSGPTVFQEIAGFCLWIVGSVLFVAAACWIVVAQLERARKERRGPDAELLQLLEDIKDRGYDTVDRLEKLLDRRKP